MKQFPDIPAVMSSHRIKCVVVLFMLALLPSGLFGQEYFHWRMSPEPVWKDGHPNGYAELHFLSASYLSTTMDVDMQWWKADLLTMGLGVAWEVKDALIPYEKAGYLGGEGFGTGDLIADLTGVVTHRLTILVWNKLIHGKWDLNRQPRNTLNGSNLR